MKLYTVVLEYYLRPCEDYSFASLDKAKEKFEELKAKLDAMDILQRRYYKLYISEHEEGEDPFAHYTLPKEPSKPTDKTIEKLKERQQKDFNEKAIAILKEWLKDDTKGE